MTTVTNDFTANPSDNNRFSNRLKMLAIGLCVVGTLAIVFPLVSSVAIETILGIAVLLAGFMHGIHAYQPHKWSLSEFVWGGILVLGGISLVTHPIHGLVALTLLIGLVFVVEGVAKILLGLFRVPTHKMIFVFDGVIGVAIGVFILLNLPSTALWVVGTLVGIRFLVAGIVTFSLSSAARQVISSQTIEN